MNKPIQIFKPGKHTAMSGASLEFTESDLQAAAKAYDPAIHEAPIVVGHPKHDLPAYGWVKSLAFSEGGLDAEPDQVDQAFAEMVAAGKFKKISASFYTPDAATNPVPGVYYLRHVGFLGAQPPAVKGLKPVEFSDSQEGVVSFGDWDDSINAQMWRRLRDWIISKFGIDEADKVIDGWSVQALADSAAQPGDDDLNASLYSESNSQTKGNTMTPEEKARMESLEADNATLKTTNTTLQGQVTQFSEREKSAKTAAIHTENVAFVEALIKEGKLLPTHKQSTIALLDNLGAQEGKVEFGEGDTKTTKTPLEVYRDQLKASPKLVDFSEQGHTGTEHDNDNEDPSMLAHEAAAFAESEARAGRQVNSAQAVVHVKQLRAKK